MKIKTVYYFVPLLAVFFLAFLVVTSCLARSLLSGWMRARSWEAGLSLGSWGTKLAEKACLRLGCRVLIWCLPYGSDGEKEVEQHGEEKVGDEDGERGVNHGFGGALPDPYGAIGGLEPLVAGDQDDEDAKDEPFD